LLVVAGDAIQSCNCKTALINQSTNQSFSLRQKAAQRTTTKTHTNYFLKNNLKDEAKKQQICKKYGTNYNRAKHNTGRRTNFAFMYRVRARTKDTADYFMTCRFYARQQELL